MVINSFLEDLEGRMRLKENVEVGSTGGKKKEEQMSGCEQ